MAQAADECITKVAGIDKLGPQAVRRENTSLLTQMITDLGPGAPYGAGAEEPNAVYGPYGRVGTEASYIGLGGQSVGGGRNCPGSGVRWPAGGAFADG